MKIYTTTNFEIIRYIKTYFNLVNKEVEITMFSDGEIYLRLKEEPINESIVLIQSIATPVNNVIMQTLFLIELIKLTCVRNIILIISYLGYSRQDRQSCKLTLASACLICKLLSNVNRIYIVEPHCLYLLTYFNCPSFEINIAALICEHISRGYDLSNIILIALDHGAINRIKRISQSLHIEYINAIKIRCDNGIKIELITNLYLPNKICIIIDDIIDTGKSLIYALIQLSNKYNLRHVIIYCTHAVLSNGMITQLDLVLSNSIPKKSAQLNISYLLSRIIKHVLAHKCQNELL